jgi:hypothetical protein
MVEVQDGEGSLSFLAEPLLRLHLLLPAVEIQH